ncbi:unnamed protein product [Ceratitis capitata]|uniref:(Mediterranean fruit fly) hypothetical protein n=1 Tax=Ceratitis capitata TaxID=7213 RepID=A0A811UDE6_CERCA|nr:unnamed protein product [Ceratitis capitata]
MSAIANIEKLSADNYATWSVQVKSLLITLDLWDVVICDCPSDESGKSVWFKNDQKALATITLCVKPSELVHIKSCVTSKEAWRVLNSIYRKDSAGRKVSLFKRLIHFKVSMQDKFATRVNEFCSIVDELKEVGVIVPDDFASILLLCSLPDEMESFVVAIESRDNLPKIDVLVSKILETEIRQNDKSAVNDEKVFLTKSRKFGAKRFEHTRSNIICFKCGKAGHIRSQCRGFVAKENSSDKACCLFETKSQNRDMWLFDSGASSHMCMDKKFFNELEPKRQEIVLASGETIYAQGIGSVSLKTEFTNIKLHNVWYVPELTSNFFSIGKALKYGHTVKFSKNNAIMKTGKGENMLSAKFVGGAFVVKMALKKTAQKVNAIVETKQSVKWHERFGHVNMNDIRTLYNKN